MFFFLEACNFVKITLRNEGFHGNLLDIFKVAVLQSTDRAIVSGQFLFLFSKRYFGPCQTSMMETFVEIS